MLLVSVIATLGVGPLFSRSGSLEGKVIDEQTQSPITNATVPAWPEEGSAGKIINTLTDTGGKLVLEGLPAGASEVAAAKSRIIIQILGPRPWEVISETSKRINFKEAESFMTSLFI